MPDVHPLGAHPNLSTKERNHRLCRYPIQKIRPLAERTCWKIRSPSRFGRSAATTQLWSVGVAFPTTGRFFRIFQAAGSADEAEHRALSYWTSAPGAVTREPWPHGVGVLRPLGRASRIRER